MPVVIIMLSNTIVIRMSCVETNFSCCKWYLFGAEDVKMYPI